MKFDKNLNKIFAISNLHTILNISKTFLSFYVLLQNLALISTLQKLSFFINYQFSFISDICSSLNYLLRFFDTQSSQNFQFLFKNILLLLIVQGLMVVVLVLFLKLNLQSNKSNGLKQQKSIRPLTVILNVIYLTKMPLNIIFINFIRREISFGSYVILIVPFLLIIQLAGLTFVLQQFRNSSNFLNPAPNDKVYEKNQGLFQVGKMLMKALITVGIWSIDDERLIILLLILLLINNVIDLKSMVIKKMFLHPFTQGLKAFERVLNTNCNAIIIITFLIKNESVSYNVIFIIINTCLLTAKAVHSYKTYRNKRIFLESKTIVKEDELLILMIEVIKAQRAQDNEYFKNSIFHQHKDSCSNIDCPCKTMDFASDDKVQKTKSLMRIIKIILKEIINRQNKGNLLLLSIYLDYQITVMKSFTSIHSATNLFSGHSKSTIQIGQKYVLFQIQRAVQANLHALNQTSFIELDAVFKEQQTYNNLIKCIETINSKNIKKYNLLMQESCDLNIIKDICKEITENIRKIQDIWERQEISKSYNIKILQLYLVYCIYILMSRQATNQVRGIIKKKLFVLQSIKGVNLSNLTKYMYNKNCCIIESQLNDVKKFGQISNITNNCIEVFKMERIKMINDNVHSLMANFLSGPHQKVSNKWLEDESLSGSLKNIIKIIFVDKRGMSFSGNLYLKIHSSGSLLIFYAIIIKQSNSDYMVIDHQGVIESFGSRLAKEGMLNSSHIQENISRICQFDIAEQMKDNEILKTKLLVKDSLNALAKSFLNDSKKKSSKGFSKVVDANSKQECYFDCNVTIKKEYMGDYQYFTITFLDIAKIKRKKTHLSFCNLSQSPQYHQIWNTKFKQTKQQVRWDQKSLDLDMPRLDEEVNNMGGETNSVNSSVTGNQVSVKIRKFFDQSREKVKDYSQITDSCLSKTSIAIIIIVFISSFFIFFQNMFFDNNKASFIKNLNQYSIISFNFMEIEVGFDQLITLNAYCRDQPTLPKCQELIQVSFLNTFEVYEKYVEHFSNFLEQIQYVSQMQYQYLNLQVKIIHNSKEEASTIKELIQQFFYSYKILLTKINTNDTRSIFYSSDFNFILNNWNNVKDANGKIQDFYQQIIDQQTMITVYIVLIIFAFLIASAIGIIYSWHCCKRYFENKKFNVSLLSAQISRKFCQNYRKMITALDMSKENRKQFIYFTEFAQFQQISVKPSRTVKYSRSKRYIYFLLIIFLILMVMYACLFASYMLVITNTPNQIQSVKNIIKASERLLYRYITVKKNFLYNSTVDDWALVQKELAYPEAEINAYVKQSFIYIHSHDSLNYQNVFINDICQLLVNQVSQLSHFECTQINNSIFDLGIIAAMNYIRIESYANYQKLNGKSSAVALSEYSQPSQSTMNNYGYYIVKLCGLIEKKIISLLQENIQEETSNVHAYEIIQTIILVLILIVWLTDIKDFKKSISDLYGQVLQLPKVIFKEAKSNMIHLESLLHFDF